MATTAVPTDPAQRKQRSAVKPDESQPPRQRLELPRESSLVKQLRLQNPAAAAPAAPPAQRPGIGAAPQSDLLGRLQQFLPAMQSANAQLATAPGAKAAPGALDIRYREVDSDEEESDDSAAEPHIVMDLACGVFDLKDEAAMAAAARQMSSAGGGMPMQAAGDTSSSDDNSDEDSDEQENEGAGEEPQHGEGASPAEPAVLQSEGQLHSKGCAAAGTNPGSKRQQKRGRHRGIQEL